MEIWLQAIGYFILWNVKYYANFSDELFVTTM